jgi:hypothetical protein
MMTVARATTVSTAPNSRIFSPSRLKVGEAKA